MVHFVTWLSLCNYAQVCQIAIRCDVSQNLLARPLYISSYKLQIQLLNLLRDRSTVSIANLPSIHLRHMDLRRESARTERFVRAIHFGKTEVKLLNHDAICTTDIDGLLSSNSLHLIVFRGCPDFVSSHDEEVH